MMKFRLIGRMVVPPSRFNPDGMDEPFEKVIEARDDLDAKSMVQRWLLHRRHHVVKRIVRLEDAYA